MYKLMWANFYSTEFFFVLFFKKANTIFGEKERLLLHLNHRVFHKRELSDKTKRIYVIGDSILIRGFFPSFRPISPYAIN